MTRLSLFRCLPRCLIVLLALQATSCGTLIHPERRGQPYSGRLDPAIVALDAVGLLLFFIPGVIAFAVDFSNGTIYLPPESASLSSPPSDKNLRTVKVNPDELTSQRLEALVLEQTGQSVSLQPGEYKAARINGIQDFNSQTLQTIPVPARVTFRASDE